MDSRVKRVLVLGGGSAGFLAAISLKTKLPQLEVVVIRSKEIGTIMVGEGTTDSVPRFLHGYLLIDPGLFYAQARPSWKLGIRFLWGGRPHFNYTFTRQLDNQLNGLSRANGYYCEENFEYADVTGALMQHDRVFARDQNGLPVVDMFTAYHLENEKIVGFFEDYAPRLGIEVLDDTVDDVRQNNLGISEVKLKSGRSEKADLFVDCSGFRSVLLRGALKEPFISYDSSLFCDRAVTGGWMRGDDEPILPYTTSETMDAGWAWKIEHETLVNRGYVYSSNFISDEDAEDEFRKKNPKVESTRIVKFATGRYRNMWVKNVVAIGNAGGFVEPLEASSLATICEACAYLVKSLSEANLTIEPTQVRLYNRFANKLWDDIRKFLAVHYRFNTRMETPFWQACCADVDLAGAEEIVEYYRANGPALTWGRMILGAYDPFGYEGYLNMLVGQNVSYRNTYRPTAEEWRVWNQARAEMMTIARQGFPVREALDMVHDPRWSWDIEFFKRAAYW